MVDDPVGGRVGVGVKIGCGLLATGPCAVGSVQEAISSVPDCQVGAWVGLGGQIFGSSRKKGRGMLCKECYEVLEACKTAIGFAPGCQVGSLVGGRNNVLTS